MSKISWYSVSKNMRSKCLAIHTLFRRQHAGNYSSTSSLDSSWLLLRMTMMNRNGKKRHLQGRSILTLFDCSVTLTFLRQPVPGLNRSKSTRASFRFNRRRQSCMKLPCAMARWSRRIRHFVRASRVCITVMCYSEDQHVAGLEKAAYVYYTARPGQ